LPTAAECGDGIGIQHGGIDTGHDLGREVDLRLAKDQGELIHGHGLQAAASPHQIAALVVHRAAGWTRRNDEREHAPLGGLDLDQLDTQMQPNEQTDFGPVGCVECRGAHDPAGQLVGDAQDHAASAFVRQRTLVAAQFLEIVPVLGLLELDVLRLAVEQQSLLEVVFTSNDHVTMWACR
jgi:hypothetical protein